MIEKKYKNLYTATRDFLECIRDAQILYDSKKFTICEESMRRTKLRQCFENYIQMLSVREYNFGPIMTKRSREFVELKITEFIDAPNQCQTQIAHDILIYKKIIDESREVTIAVL